MLGTVTKRLAVLFDTRSLCYTQHQLHKDPKAIILLLILVCLFQLSTHIC
jgi:hypothetical protein